VVTLFINSHGFTVSKRGGLLVVKFADGSKREIALSRLSLVVVSARGSFSTDVVRALALENVPIIFASHDYPYAVLHPLFMHATVVTRREQMRALGDERGYFLARAFSYATTLNKARVLRYFAKSRSRDDPDLAEYLRSVANRIEFIASEIHGFEGSLDDSRFKILGLEGEAARIYYDALRYLFPPDLGFKGREKRPPRDPVNSALSFGYTLLNSIVLLAILKVGLEPYAGFLHTDRSGKPSLVLDLSEEFRQPVVDVLVVSLFSKRVLGWGDFMGFDERGVLLLNEEGRNKYVSYFSNRLRGRVSSRDYSSFESSIMRQARLVARYLLGRVKIYNPFIWRWG